MNLYEKFSNSSNYVIELIPKNVNFFNKKKWIKEKLKDFNEEKVLVFSDKKKMIITFLKEEEEFWLPFEKGKFYLNQAESCDGNVLIIEIKKNNTFLNHNEFFYYVMIGQFLVTYTTNYEEALESLKKYGYNALYKTLIIGHEKIEYSNIESNNQKFLSYDDIAKKIEYKKELSEINNELIYLQEEHDQNNLNFNNSENTDLLFYHWFENVREKSQTWLFRLKICLFSVGCIFFVFSYYFMNQTYHINCKITEVIQKIDKL